MITKAHIGIIALMTLSVIVAGVFFNQPEPTEIPEPPKQQTQTRTATLLQPIEERLGATGGPTGAGAAAGETTVCSDNMNWGAIGGTELQSNDTTYIEYTGNNWDDTEISDGLYASTFGFSTSGTIDGIQVEVINWATGGGDYEDIILGTAQGTRVGDDKADSTEAMPSADPSSTYDSWGGSSDHWNASLSPAQVNDAGFGVEFCYQSGGDNNNIFVDHVRVTVTYTPSAPADEPVRSQTQYFSR